MEQTYDESCYTFIKQVEAKVETGETFIIYLTGAEDASGTSWCSDCVNNKEVINEKFIKPAKYPVLKGIVKTAEEWKGNE